MKIGVPKEIKPQENRIGLTPESVKTLISEGHKVIVENNGGFEASKPPLFSTITLCPSEIKVFTLSGVRPILFS